MRFLTKVFTPFALLFLFLSGCSSTAFNNSTLNSNINPPSDIRVLSDVNTIAFEWNLLNDANVAGYHIYRKKASEQQFSKIATLDSRFNTHYADNKLEANTQYVYQFASFDKNGSVSPYSNAIYATTQSIAPVSYIEAISNYPRKVKIIWSPHVDTRVTGYSIERKNNDGSFKEIADIKNRLLVEHLDLKLDDETTYTYRILAYNANKTYSAPSQIVSATTKPKPTIVTNFSATTSIPKKVSLNWDLHPNQEVVNYKILRSSLVGFSTIATIPSNVNTYEDVINKDGASYRYKIIATDKDGIDSLDSAEITGSTLPVPATPVITYAQIENGSVVIRWNPSDNRATEYIVYKKDSTFFGETLRYNKVLTPEFIDHEIKAGEKYHYGVSALDENGLESKPTKDITLSLPK